jgi:hypothetical protein
MQQCGPILPRKHLLQTLLRSPIALYSRSRNYPLSAYTNYEVVRGAFDCDWSVERGQIDPFVLREKVEQQ